jgi:hypothetical protein
VPKDVERPPLPPERKRQQPIGPVEFTVWTHFTICPLRKRYQSF